MHQEQLKIPYTADQLIHHIDRYKIAHGHEPISDDEALSHIKHLGFSPTSPEAKQDLETMNQAAKAQTKDEEDESPEYDVDFEARKEVQNQKQYDRIEKLSSSAKQKDAEALFGEADLAAAKKQEASDETTEQLLNTIQALTKNEKKGDHREYERDDRTKFQRRLKLKGDDGHLKQTLHLNYYPNGTSDLDHQVDREALAEVWNFRQSVQTLHAFDTPEELVALDSIYINNKTGEAMLKRSFETDNDSQYKFMTAERPATDQEINEALDLIAQMVTQEEQASKPA
jgi:hypothetical protein